MKTTILVLLLISSLFLAFAPFFMTADYDWRLHSISESAGQNTVNAWIARAGLSLYGIAIMFFAFSAPIPNNFRYLPFGIAMILVATWSNKPISPGATFDPLEDTLHSVGSALVGMSFIFAVIASQFSEPERPTRVRIFDLLAALASITIPLLMSWNENVRGLAQRAMFLVSYAWFVRELQVNSPRRQTPTL